MLEPQKHAPETRNQKRVPRPVRDLSFDQTLSFSQQLIRIPSPPGGEGDVAERVRGEYEALGFDDAWIDENGSAIGRIRGRGEAPAVMLSCHLDVVDVGDVSSWEHPPFDGVVADGFLHGRGAMDIKGPLAIQTYAAARFVEDRPAGDIIVAHTVLEERGGWGMERLIASGEVSPAAVIIGESTNGDICIGHRGRAELVVEITGVAGHASAPDRASNPVHALPLVIPAIERFNESLSSDPVLGRATLAPTAIETLPTSYNVISDIVRIVIDWRILPDTTADGAVDSLRAFLRASVELPEPIGLDVRYSTERQRTWTGQERDRRMYTPGFLMRPDAPVVRAALHAIATKTGRTPAVRPWTFATDGGHTCGVHGIPTIGYAPGEERHAHTNTERLDLRAARMAWEAYPHLIASVQAAAASADAQS
jgi:putative selenium metabolism hydrolase